MREFLKDRSRELGFELFGVASIQNDPLFSSVVSEYDAWLKANFHGTMGYLPRHRKKKSSPELFLEFSKSVVCVGAFYKDQENNSCGESETDSQPKRHSHAMIAAYSKPPDYHVRIKQALSMLVDESVDKFGGKYKVFVDTSPVFERFWGQRAGLGWIGKNTLLINRKSGSYFFLGGFFTDQELSPDLPGTAHCGKCTKCIDACPTNAIVPSPGNTGRWTVNANNCISYLTIEYRGEIDKKLSGKMNNWVAGCDVCQTVCPWNSSYPEKSILLSGETIPILSKPLNELKNWTEQEYLNAVKGYSIERISFSNFKRNIEIALANSKQSSRKT